MPYAQVRVNYVGRLGSSGGKVFIAPLWSLTPTLNPWLHLTPALALNPILGLTPALTLTRSSTAAPLLSGLGAAR